ncbi:SET domain-containing protein SmydA-8-like [Anopheles aquasalis]|uniref:SET domain-containing protein SmydA-8-like n=1 Tax=Anopheles aquasalis TaxID=42839 RepID=UPI00215AF964|nr:SET domain-containing protein SmydA-8-like [Anopheles aquasalis]XP_050099781.1 SET domain-containing protein SmydA-8-like [Anopheles aquasalis]
MVSTVCAVCSAPASQQCAGCQQTVYCGRDHQRQHWKATHRRECHCYRVVENASLGRYVIATRKIRQGEIIFRDVPAVVGPKMASVPVCLGCNRDLMATCRSDERFHECSRCGWPVCGAECEGAEQHRTECSILAGSSYRPKIRPARDEPTKRESAYCAIVPLRVLLLQSHAPDTYAQLQRLESHVEERLKSPLYEVVRSNLVPFVRTVLGLQQYSAETILQVCAILDTNCFEIRLPERWTKVRALYPLGAMLSHDCRPNTKHYFDDTLRMVLVATVDIERGGTISASYTQPLLGTLHRRLALKQSKHFECQCERCTDPTELGTSLSGFRCPKCRKGIVLPAQPCNPQSVWRCRQRNCAFSETATVYAARCTETQQQLLNLNRAEPGEYEAFIRQHQTSAHGWNAFVLQAKYALIQLLDHRTTVESVEQSEVSLRRTVELCHDLLAVADHLEPGLGFFRVKLLVTLEKALATLQHRCPKPSSKEGAEWSSLKEELNRISRLDPSMSSQIIDKK